jgi:hypothetical protein
MKSAHIFDERICVLLFVRDYLNRGDDQFFLYEDEVLRECSAGDVVSFPGAILTHDYGLIASAIFRETGALPKRVLDIIELHRATVGERTPIAATRDTAFHLLRDAGLAAEDARQYAGTLFGRSTFDANVYSVVAAALMVVGDALLLRAYHLGELARFIDVEVPVAGLMWRSLVKGVRIDTEKLRQYKKTIDDDYFRELGKFAVKHGVAFELPNDEVLRERLDGMGMDVENASVNYILSYLHFDDGFGEDVLSLRKLAKSRSLLLDMPVSHPRAYPLPVVAGTVTSRILLHGPSLQNLGKKHRDLICPEDGSYLEYVDYAQFEVGVMVGLADDPFMRELYASGDLYLRIAERLFGGAERRSIAKRLFLSYSYGMSVKRVVDAAVEQGATREVANTLFRSFSTFESWKKTVQASYQDSGIVATSFGNSLIRRQSGALAAKEGRSCVSQIVQGTASLIFKRALLELSSLDGIEILVPMHDAVLFQSSLQYSGVQVKRVFEGVFDNHFEGRVRGRAEISQFL